MLKLQDKISGISLPENIAVIDIETAGLFSERYPVFMIGLMISSDSDSCILRQFAIDGTNPGEEKEMLNEFSKYLSYSFVTYNGNFFDLPYLKTRFIKNNLVWTDPVSIDLFSWIKSRKKFFDFPNLKLKALEKYAGIERKDELSGKEVSDMYKMLSKIEETKKILFMDKMLLHNKEDVINLAKLMPLFNSLKESLSFSAEYMNAQYSFLIDSFKIKKDFAYISAISDLVSPIKICYQNNGYVFAWENNDLSLKLPIYRGTANLNGKDEPVITGILTAKKGEAKDASPYNLKYPLCVLSDSNKYYSENMIEILLNAFERLN